MQPKKLKALGLIIGMLVLLGAGVMAYWKIQAETDNRANTGVKLTYLLAASMFIQIPNDFSDKSRTRF